MSEFVEAQIYLLGVCAVIGVELEMLYLVVRWFRVIIKHCQLALYVEDIIFFVAAAIYTYYILYDACYGKIRCYYFVFIAASAIVVENIFGRKVLRLLKIIDKRFKIGTSKILKIIFCRKEEEVEKHHE